MKSPASLNVIFIMHYGKKNEEKKRKHKGKPPSNISAMPFLILTPP